MTKAETIQEIAEGANGTFSLKEIAEQVPCTYARVREVLILTGKAEKVKHGHYRLVGTDFEPPADEPKPAKKPAKAKPAAKKAEKADGPSDAQVYKAVMNQDPDAWDELPDGWVETAKAYAKRTKKKAPKA